MIFKCFCFLTKNICQAKLNLVVGQVGSGNIQDHHLLTHTYFIFWSFNSVFIVVNYLFPNVRTGWHHFLLTANYVICCFMSKNIPLCFCVCVPTYAPPTDPESQRKRTVQNVLDLRQNLEETMTSLRGVQLSHRSATRTHPCMHARTHAKHDIVL